MYLYLYVCVSTHTYSYLTTGASKSFNRPFLSLFVGEQQSVNQSVNLYLLSANAHLQALRRDFFTVRRETNRSCVARPFPPFSPFSLGAKHCHEPKNFALTTSCQDGRARFQNGDLSNPAAVQSQGLDARTVFPQLKKHHEYHL